MFKKFLNSIINFFQREEKSEYLIIPKNSVFNGELSGKVIYIDGQLTTDDLSTNYLEIGNNGCINGNICAEKIYISGKVNGNITCDIIVLQKGAHVIGSIWCNNILIQKESILNGDIYYALCSIEQGSFVTGKLEWKLSSAAADNGNDTAEGNIANN